MNKPAHPIGRKLVAVSLDAELVAEAEALGIDVARLCERRLKEQLTTAEQWRRKNAEAIASSNAWVERNGLPLARYRQF